MKTLEGRCTRLGCEDNVWSSPSASRACILSELTVKLKGPNPEKEPEGSG
jgi:hypothetical protein